MLRVQVIDSDALMDAEAIVEDIRSHGASVEELVELARSSRETLSDALKAAGFTKMGARKKVEQFLVARAASEPAAAIGPTEPSTAPRLADDAAMPTGTSVPPASSAPVAAASAPTPTAQAACEQPSLSELSGVDRLQAEGKAAFVAGRYEDAVKLYTEALQHSPDDATLFSNRSAARLILDQKESALEDAVQAVELRPTWGKAHGRHGAALFALGCLKDAIAAYERGLKLSPDSLPMRTEVSRLRSEQAAAVAATAAAAAAAATYDEQSVGSPSARDVPDSPPPNDGRADPGEPIGNGQRAADAAPPPKKGREKVEVLGRRSDGTGGQKYVRVADTDELQAEGKEAYQAGDYEDAVAKWTQALRRRPDDETLLSNRSAAHLQMGDHKAALADAEQAIKAKPGWPKARLRLADALCAHGRYEEALSVLAKTVDLEEADEGRQKVREKIAWVEAEAKNAKPPKASGVALTGLDLARECNRLGRPQQAVRELDKLIGNAVQDAELYCERSIAHANSSLFSKAVEDAGTAVYLYGQQHDPELKPWESPKELGIRLMTRQQKNELAKQEGRAFLLRGQAETRLCDYDAAMRTFQLGCKADARLGPEALKELRTAWYAAKELCRGWRRAGRQRKLARKKAAFLGERQPVLADIAKFEEPADKALALRNLASIHSKWDLHDEAIELLTLAMQHTPNDHYLTHQRVKEHLATERYDLALPDAQLVLRERPGWIEGMITLGNVSPPPRPRRPSALPPAHCATCTAACRCTCLDQ